MRRRGVGIAAVKAKQKWKEEMETVGTELQETRAEHVKKSMERFQAALEEFVVKHTDDIKSNPQFRARFHQMCAQAGIDPLASQKGLWSKMLGLGDFYYELGIQTLEVCIAARAVSGVLVPMSKLLAAVRKKRARTIAQGRGTGKNKQAIDESDIRQAVRKLSVLGGGFQVVDIGGEAYVRSVPGELDQDANAALAEAKMRGYTSVALLGTSLGWEGRRAQITLDGLVTEGLAWVDDGDTAMGRLFWMPSLSGAMQDAALSET